MEIFPIWKDTYYSSAEESLTFRIMKGSEEIYRARASRYPDEDTLRINLNKPCKNHLDSRLVPPKTNADTVLKSNAYGEFSLQVLNQYDGWDTVYEVAFYNDWSYFLNSELILNEPINSKAAPGQVIPGSYLVTGDTATKCYN